MYPYPSTYYCDVPTEMQNDERLCCPLPNSVFPREKPVAKPAPGKYYSPSLNKLYSLIHVISWI